MFPSVLVNPAPVGYNKSVQRIQIRSHHVVRLVEQIGEYYRTNISNRYIHPALSELQLDKPAWALIEGMTDKEQFHDEGFLLDDLYRQIAAMAQFIELARRDLTPNLRSLVSMSNSSGPERVIRDMAVNNFSSNLKVFAALINDLYSHLKEMDIAETGERPPLYLRMPELKDVGPKRAG
jgi:hypothetical protein